MTKPMSLSESQWNTIMQTVHDEALRARVAASFLPLYGPLPPDTISVPKNTLEHSSSGTRLAVNDHETMQLTTLSVNVCLKNAQMADPELTSALIMFRRAAEVMARVEDAIIFNGQDAAGDPVYGASPQKIYQTSGGIHAHGLLSDDIPDVIRVPIHPPTKGFSLGQQVFSAVVESITRIEKAGHHGPFACVLGNELFTAINRPMPNSMVLPREGIVPFLEAPLLRSSAIDDYAGVLVSLRGAPVEIVVPSDISVRFLTTTPDAEHVFRVQQKFVLRIKEAPAIAQLHAE